MKISTTKFLIKLYIATIINLLYSAENASQPAVGIRMPQI